MDLIKSTRGIGPRGIWRAGLPTPRSTQPQPSHPLVRFPTPCCDHEKGKWSRVGMQSWCISPSPPFLPCFLRLPPPPSFAWEQVRLETRGWNRALLWQMDSTRLDGLGQFSIPFHDCPPTFCPFGSRNGTRGRRRRRRRRHRRPSQGTVRRNFHS